ncbi:MAG: hypothetical protein AMXMBFR56_51510 [Polyangiaceae bacterium]
MPRVVLEPEAERDITDAYDWYEEQRSGLGERFLASVAESLEQIARAPKANPIVERSVRRKLLRTSHTAFSTAIPTTRCLSWRASTASATPLSGDDGCDA